VRLARTAERISTQPEETEHEIGVTYRPTGNIRDDDVVADR